MTDAPRLDVRKGFGVLEAVLVVAAISLMATIAFLVFGHARERALREERTAVMAAEIDRLADAARRFAEARYHDWPTGTIIEVALDDLRAQGYLEAPIGRTGLFGWESPLGTRYRVLGQRDGADPRRVRLVITETRMGLPPTAFRNAIAQLGITPTDEALRSLYGELRKRLRAIHSKLAVVLPADGSDPMAQAVASWMPGDHDPRIAVLIGWPELAEELQSTPRPDEQVPINPSRCIIASSMGSTPAQCPATHVEVARFPRCAAALNGGTMPIINTRIGPVILEPTFIAGAAARCGNCNPALARGCAPAPPTTRMVYTCRCERTDSSVPWSIGPLESPLGPHEWPSFCRPGSQQCPWGTVRRHRQSAPACNVHSDHLPGGYEGYLAGWEPKVLFFQRVKLGTMNLTERWCRTIDAHADCSSGTPPNCPVRYYTPQDPTPNVEDALCCERS